jgi:hypothetical protein
MSYKGAIRILVGLCAVAVSGCVRNTVDSSADGRLFLLLDVPSTRVDRQVIQISLEIENMDPMRLVIFDRNADATGLNIDITGALDWRDVQSRSLLLGDEVIKGGSEVRFTVRSNQFDQNQTTFRMDGNSIVRLFVSNPNMPGIQHIEIELTVQQALF